MTKCAVIGGSGLNQLGGFERVCEYPASTPWGEVSHPVQEGHFAGQPIFFLARHGIPHSIPPHGINYRANIWALRELGVTRVIAINAVGGIGAGMGPGTLALPDQVIDYTWGREHTYYDGGELELEHIEFTQPYSTSLHADLVAAAQSAGISCQSSATYAATQGPRLETAAEVERLRRDGCDLVGMTGMPEAALAAEAGLEYAAICMVVNWGAGLGDEPITLAAMNAILEDKAVTVGTLLEHYLRAANQAS